MKPLVLRSLYAAVLTVCLSTVALAQRDLHWSGLQVTASLDADGTLHVAEVHTMVFTGDWNGGERTFNIRPRQKLTFTGLDRADGTAWQPLTENDALSRIDDYAWADSRTLRWRSRLRSDPPFNGTTLRYQLRYDLSGILLPDADGYLLDHDFAFPDRAGPIGRFELRLTLDPAWRTAEPLRDLYAANNLAPGQSFVLKLPLRYSGAGTPAVLDSSRPRAIALAVVVILGLMLLDVAWFFFEERRNGRFDPIPQEDQIDSAWLRQQLLKYPAELVGAAWDDRIGQPEVVSLLARMTTEGKLESTPSGGVQHPTMTLRLKVDRSTLSGYERKLVDALFWDDRTTTSTDQVKSHYEALGFNPVSLINKDLAEALKSAFPFRDAPRNFRVETLVLFVIGIALLAAAWHEGYGNGKVIALFGFASAIYAGFASLAGSAFRSRMDWGPGKALVCLIPALLAATAIAAFLWYAGSGAIELQTMTIAGIACLAVAVTNSSINSLKSRQRREGIAARKTLAAARAYFVAQLSQRRPALEDEWYPWMLAFGLTKQMDDWSARGETAHDGSSVTTWSPSTGSSHSSTWTGFGGGRSGGGGGGAAWAAAAGGIASGVAPPSSSGSGGGSSGGGGGGGGGSSGGGGGGGW